MNSVATNAFSFLSGGGEMGERIMSYNWSETTLGPIDTWPQSLRTSLSLILTSYYPLFFWWGEDHIQFYNDAYIPILGSKHPKSLGQKGKECWPEAWHLVAPLIESVKQGQSTFNKNTMLPLQRNGYTEECYFDFAYSPIRNEAGEVAGIFATVSETTDQVLNERRLGVLAGFGMHLLEAKSMPEACQLSLQLLSQSPIDIPYGLIYLKEAAGYKLAGSYGLEACPQARPELIPAQEPEADQAGWNLHRVITSRQSLLEENLDLRYGTLPGHPWPAPSHSALLLPLHLPGQNEPMGVFVAGISPGKAFNNAYGRFLKLVASHIETALTNGKAYEEERLRMEKLLELDQAKTNFFSNVSHEFRTPLTLMLGPLQDILSKANTALPAADRQQLTTVYQNALRLLKLVNTLLDFSRIEAQRTQACFEPTDLALTTCELASAFESAVKIAGLEYKTACPSLSEPIYVDPEMWEKIVLNLISNALKFTFEGQITVTLQETPTHACLQVQDTGVGIAPQELPNLFKRFHRIQNSRSRSHEGTGIGLALVKELVELQGGAITVDSEPGQGTTFTVSIPKGAAHLEQSRIRIEKPAWSTAVKAEAYVNEAQLWLNKSEALPLASKNLVGYKATKVDQQMRILLADDNTQMLHYLSRILSAYWQVETVSDGHQALAAIRRQAPDLVVSDVMMPGMNGYDLLAAIRQDSSLSHIPVVLLSARSGEEAVLEGLDKGANDYLMKPFSAPELIARIRTQLEITRTRKDNALLKAAQEELKKFKAISDHAFDAFILMREDGSFAYLNDLALQRWGYTREEAATIRVPDVDPIYQQDKFNEVFALAQKQEISPFETLHKRKDGTIYPVEVSMGGITLEGKPHMFAVARDISERKQAAEALAVSEEHFRTFANNIQNLAWMANADGWAFWFNERWYEYTGTSPAQMAGWTWQQLVHPDHLPQVLTVIQEGMRHHETWELTFPLKKANGEYRWFLTRAYAVKNKEGQVIRWIGTNTDIQEQKKAEEELQHKNEELRKINSDLDNFIYTASHDLKAPITNIEGLIDTLVEDLPAEILQTPIIDKVIALTRKAIGRFKITIEDLTDLSKINRESQEDVSSVDLAALFEEVRMDLDVLIQGPGARFEVDFQQCPSIRFSRKNLRSILSNLVSNAVKYHSPHRRPLIQVSARTEHNCQVLTVTDNGLGMDLSQENKIFSMFKRLHDHVEGSGIGLYIVKKIVENSGGKITVDSAVDKGSTFQVYFRDTTAV